MPDTFLFVLVLLSALMNGAWNSIIKIRAERIQVMGITTLTASVLSLPALAFFGWPPPSSWGWLALSVAVHTAYHFALPLAYRYGDLGQVYPIARGSAPLIVMLLAALLAQEPLRLGQVLGVALLCGGIFFLTRASGGGALQPQALGAALVTGVLIGAYTVVDGLGARQAGVPLAYGAAMTVGGGLATSGVLLAWKGRAMFRADRSVWVAGSAAAALQLGATWIAIWALAHAPLAVVSALRETAVLWVALFSAFVLKEKLGRWRLGSSVLVLCGLLLMRLAA